MISFPLGLEWERNIKSCEWFALKYTVDQKQFIKVQQDLAKTMLVSL